MLSDYLSDFLSGSLDCFVCFYEYYAFVTLDVSVCIVNFELLLKKSAEIFYFILLLVVCACGWSRIGRNEEIFMKC